MDKGTLQGIATILTMVAFIGTFLWAYSARNKDRFDEAANLPFADEDKDKDNDSANSTTHTDSGDNK